MNEHTTLHLPFWQIQFIVSPKQLNIQDDMITQENIINEWHLDLSSKALYRYGQS